MRVALLHLGFLLLPLVDCGSKQDLLIGIVPLSEAGTAGASSGMGASPATGGADAVAGVGGTGAMAGSSDGGTTGEAAGAAGAAGDTGEPCISGEAPPLGSLIHRYTFDGSGMVATDAIGGTAWDGDILGAALDGSSMLTLNGSGAQYVNLPDRIIHDLTDVTIVVWTAWVDGAAYGRVFDFGMNDNGFGTSYLAMLPKTGFDNQAKSGLGGEIKVPGFATVQLGSTLDMKGRAGQVSLVLKGGVSASLYFNGDELASKPTTIKPGDIDDRNNWIGHSQYNGNPGYDGSFSEFRIYDTALNSCQLQTLLFRGTEDP